MYVYNYKYISVHQNKYMINNTLSHHSGWSLRWCHIKTKLSYTTINKCHNNQIRVGGVKIRKIKFDTTRQFSFILNSYNCFVSNDLNFIKYFNITANVHTVLC